MINKYLVFYKYYDQIRVDDHSYRNVERTRLKTMSAPPDSTFETSNGATAEVINVIDLETGENL